MILAITTSVLGFGLQMNAADPKLAQAEVAPVVAPAAVPDSELSVEQQRVARNLKTATFFTLGVGVAGVATALAVGLGMGLPRTAAVDQETNRQKSITPTSQDADYLASLQSDRDQIVVASAAIAGGSAAVLATSLILYLVTPRAATASPPVALASLTPRIAPRKGGAEFGVAFQF